MRERQATFFNLRRRLHRVMCGRCLCAYYLCIVGAFVLLVVVGVVRFLASDPVRHDPEPVKVRTSPPPRRDARTLLPVFEVPETYYQTIIDNNLFRPLGWTPLRPRLNPIVSLVHSCLARRTPHQEPSYNPPQETRHILCPLVRALTQTPKLSR